MSRRSRLTPRQRRLVRHSLGALSVVLAITLVVWLAERPAPAEGDSGVVDVLARDLPADVPRVYFTDATAEAGIRFRHFSGTRTHRLPEDMGSGLAWGDCDGDGHDDLYIVDFAAPLGTPAEELRRRSGNALYRNRGDGTFVDMSAESGADLRGYYMGATWADADGDGNLDLYVTQYGPNALLLNDGNCRFTDVTAAAGVAGGEEEFSAGAAWGDYDGDGDLDLYVTNYVQFDEELEGTTSLQFGEAVPFTLNPASYPPSPNRLYRNDGGGRFVEVASAAGVADPEGRGMAAAWADWDEDGDLDLYVANDLSDNAMFLNRGDGTFVNASHPTLTADYRGAMGLAVGDFDRDGDLDFFVTHWIAQENGLYRNQLELAEDGVFFADVAEMMGLGYTGLEYVGWGTGFLDYDNDGWLDLLVANGHTFEDPADTTRLLPQRLQLFWRRGEEGFFDVSTAAGPAFERLLVARGAAVSDYDRDGNLDIAVLENGGPLVLLRNGGAEGHHWLAVDLWQPGGNPFAVGARVFVEAAGARQMHPVGTSASYLSADSLTAHFGLGTATAVDRVRVRWPDGLVEEWTDIPVDARQVLERGSGDESTR